MVEESVLTKKAKDQGFEAFIEQELNQMRMPHKTFQWNLIG